VYIEFAGLDVVDPSAQRSTRAMCGRAAAGVLRTSVGAILRCNDLVVAGPSARWFAALLRDRAFPAEERATAGDADVGIIAGRLRVAVQVALDELRASGALKHTVTARAGWTIIEPRDIDRPLVELRHALRGAAVVARVEERRATVMAAITHELRTPLTSIVGYAEHLSDGRWTEKTAEQKRRRAVAIIADEARRLTRLVEGLIDMGAWHAGRLTLRPAPVRLQSLVRHAVAAVAAQAKKRNIRVTVRGDAEALIDADRTLQVVVNLVANAVAHARTCIRIGIANHRRNCSIAVSDDGPGFDPELLPAIGTPFSAGRNGRAGLGLAVSKMLAEAHGGSLTVGRAPGGGARVTLRLPA
jgi:signal transduction histidine kinase